MKNQARLRVKIKVKVGEKRRSSGGVAVGCLERVRISECMVRRFFFRSPCGFTSSLLRSCAAADVAAVEAEAEAEGRRWRSSRRSRRRSTVPLLLLLDRRRFGSLSIALRGSVAIRLHDDADERGGWLSLVHGLTGVSLGSKTNQPEWSCRLAFRQAEISECVCACVLCARDQTGVEGLWS